MSTVLDTPVYTLATWQGNVTDDYGVDWVVTDEQGWSSSPPVRTSLEERGSGDGAWSGPGFYGSRVISLSGTAVAPDKATMLAAKDRLKASIGPRSLVQLQVAEEHMTRVANVRLSDQIDITDRSSYVFEFALALVAPDPRRYSPTPVTATAVLPATVVTGRTYPRVYPLGYGGLVGGSNTSVFIDQAGDYDQTPATIVFTGPLINPRVEHPESGKHLTFQLTLGYDETLVVDLGNQTALLGGSSSRTYTISASSAWFQLQPGMNELAFRGVAGSAPPDITPTPVPQMTVTAYSAWS